MTYCNWVEYTHSHTERIDNTTTRTYYTYTYHLEWVVTQVNSDYFDSPFAYHNPYRMVVPS